MIEAMLIIYLVGAGFARRLGYGAGQGRLAFISYSWLVGALAIGVIELATMRLGVPSSALPWVLRSVAALSVLSLCVGIVRDAKRDGIEPRSGDPVRRPATALVVVAAAAACLGGDIALRASREAITLGDEANVWSVRAKAIVWCGGMNERMFQLIEDHPHVWEPGYPWLDPLLQVSVGVFEAGRCEATTRVPIQMFGIVLPFLLAVALARCTTTGLSAALVGAVVLSKQYHDSTAGAGADGMIAAYALGAAAAFSRHFDAHDRGYDETRCLALGGACAAGLVFSKNEGALWAAALFLGFALPRIGTVRAEKKAVALAALPALILFLENHLRNLVTGVRVDPLRYGDDSAIRPTLLDSIGRLPAIGRKLLSEGVLNFSDTYGLVAIATIVGWLAFASSRATCRSVTIALSMVLAGFIFVYAGSAFDLEKHMHFSVERLLFQMTPLAALAIGNLATKRGDDGLSL